MPRPFRAAALLFLCLLSVPGRAEKNLKRPPGTTRYAAMTAQLRALTDYDQAHAGRMTLTSLGRSVKGRDLWLVTLHESEKLPPPAAESDGAASPPADSPPEKPKTILFLCRQHGHEPASTEGALAFIKTLVQADKDTPLASDLSRVTVCVVPMANPDGSEAFLRHNAIGKDLNRDWLRRTQPETRALYAAISRLHPSLLTDQHELYPNDTRPDFTETAGPGSPAAPDVIAACDDAQDVIQGAMLAEGFPTVRHWITDTHPARLAHRFGCVVLGIPTILFETNRLSGSGRSLASRAAAQEQFMMTVLRDGAGEREQLRAEADAWRTAHPAAPVLPAPEPASE